MSVTAPAASRIVALSVQVPDAPERDLAKRPANEPSMSTVVPSSFSPVFVNDSSNLPLLAMAILAQPSGTPPPSRRCRRGRSRRPRG